MMLVFLQQKGPGGHVSSIFANEEIFAETEISALASTCAITHTVFGKVVAANPKPVVIDWRGQRLLRYNFVLGAPDGVVEVSIIGQEAMTLCSRVLPLLGKVVRCKKVAWDGPRKQLKFGHSSCLDPADVNMSSVKFHYSSFYEVLCMLPWARVSTSGHVTMLGDPESNTKRQGKLVQEVVLENDRGQGLKIKMHYSENDTASLIY